MLRIIELCEKYTVMALISMMLVAIVAATAELAVMLTRQLLAPPRLLLHSADLMEIFGFFFMVLIGIELLETIKTYLTKDQIRVEVVFLVAMIALARKVIILDFKGLPPFLPLGIAAIILALSTGYYLLTRSARAASTKNG